MCGKGWQSTKDTHSFPGALSKAGHREGCMQALLNKLALAPLHKQLPPSPIHGPTQDPHLRYGHRKEPALSASTCSGAPSAL